MAALPISNQHLTIAEFQGMVEDGVFAEDDRLELIRGEIVEMTPIGDRHALCVMLAGDLLSDLKPRGIVNPQNPLRLPGQGKTLFTLLESFSHCSGSSNIVGTPNTLLEAE